MFNANTQRTLKEWEIGCFALSEAIMDNHMQLKYLNRLGTHKARARIQTSLQKRNRFDKTCTHLFEFFFRSYRNLQNKWQLYFERVEFDLLWNKACFVRKPSSQVYVHCNYCNKSISNPSQQSKFN